MSRDHTERTGNKYILLDLIGTGGMAEVYRCKLSGQQGFEKIIVIKKLLSHMVQDSEIVENFIDEARLAALLQHENIISIYDFGELDGSFFIAMEYLFGKDLHTIMQRARDAGSPMGAEHALLIAGKICEGMEYAHSLKDLQYRPLNLIHRDLSPHNVFITYDGKVKIIDFGIAKAELYDNRTKAGVVKGKISYMSPEQLAGEGIDLRSDIFSIGILLYEMLSGKRMYSGDTATLIRKCMHVDYVELEEIVPGLQAGIYDILQKALQKDRIKRYQSCLSMRSDIEDCLFNMRQRGDGRILQKYVRQVLKVEYEIEKTRFSQEGGKKTEKDGLAELDLTRVEHRSQISTSLIDKTVPGNFSDTVGLNVSAENHDDLRFGSFPYWQSAVAGIMICAMLLFYFQFPGFKKEEQSEPLPEVTKKGVQPVQLPRVKLPVVKKIVQVVQKPVILPGEEKKIPFYSGIEEYLSKAHKAFYANRFTQPENNSAYSHYQKVLELEPGNSVAREGIYRIGKKYGVFAEQALVEEQFSKATGFIDVGLQVSFRDPWLLSIQDKIELSKQKLIKKLFMKARQALDKNDLTTPENDCAYKYYREILDIENENSHAINGLQAIADRYAVLAEEAYRNLKITNARWFVDKGLAIDPHHRKLQELQADLARSKPGIFLKSLEKSFKPFWE